MGRLRTLLHPTDFSAVSDAAFRTATELARDRRARLVCLHVLTRPLPIGWRPLRADEGPRREAEIALRALVGRAKRRGVRGSAMLVEGVPHREIVRVAGSIHAGLIVLGTHGRRGLDRLRFGSTADRVRRTARCPVLTVRATSRRSRPRRSPLAPHRRAVTAA